MNASFATELPWLYAGLASYALATAFALKGAWQAQTIGPQTTAGNERFVLVGAVGGVLLLLTAITERWLRIGHGPFVSLFELIMSQLCSLGIVYTLSYWRVPMLRPSAVVVFPAIWILGLWILFLDPVASPYPPTYHNKWLWAHVGFGKFFLAFCLVGTGLAGVLLLRAHTRFGSWFRAMPDDARVDALAWRFMLLAFIFHSLMLVAGAVWAQDAWGRYWDWDALETSSFLNWLLLGAAIHVRTTYRIAPRHGALAIIVIFVFAFLTYFGAPFYSEAAHKGVI
ncbi:MAG: hypothetical protein GC138_02995 [Gammaproteobacteria bacterium]|nr:hypothetical protein [Gammaproteobacteria bacterium]